MGKRGGEKQTGRGADFCGRETAGQAPLRVELPAGKHEITAKYQDWPEETREVTWNTSGTRRRILSSRTGA